jgi:hypothetical protein
VIEKMSFGVPSSKVEYRDHTIDVTNRFGNELGVIHPSKFDVASFDQKRKDVRLG